MISNDLQQIKEVPAKRGRKRVTVNDADLIGRRFGRWTVLELTRDASGHAVYLCLCDCGNRGIVMRHKLLTGKSKGCVCHRGDRLVTHGMSGTPIYNIWNSMIGRCNNPRQTSYPYYGGRGISVCERWVKGDGICGGFECFLADIGERPSPEHSLDRINVNGNYEPGNVRWATKDEQCNNRRDSRYISYLGASKTIAQWSLQVGLDYLTVYMRIIKYGWPVERALSTPVQ